MEIECEQKIRDQSLLNTNRKHVSPSSSSSPAHEFSFTISLESSSNTNHEKAIDLTPADEIFFHGQLLPLHFLHNLPVSPRCSTNSRDQMVDQYKKIDAHDKTRGHSFNSYEYNTRRIRDHLNNVDEIPTKVRTRNKSFSLFGITRPRKEAEGKEGDKVHKKKPRFDMTHFLKRYMRMFSKGRTEDIQFRKQPYSFSGKPSTREGRRDLRGMRGEFSAPASMRTSPTNSGVLSATAKPPSNDSTMEELQAAIQAAIAHCKDSIAAAEKLNN